jgi:hypothetical protein
VRVNQARLAGIFISNGERKGDSPDRRGIRIDQRMSGVKFNRLEASGQAHTTIDNLHRNATVRFPVVIQARFFGQRGNFSGRFR